MTGILQACLNGGRTRGDHPAVPVTAAELARDAAAARAAGADAVHVHPRGAKGLESLDPADVAEAVAAIRTVCPGLPVGVSTGWWIGPGGPARREGILGWHAPLPDYASVNLGEPDWREVAGLLGRHGVGWEAGLWSMGDVRAYLDGPRPPGCLRVLVEIMEEDPVAALRAAHPMLAALRAAGADLPVLLHGRGGSVWAMVEAARDHGLSTRIGLEDALALPDGTPAPGNSALVATARAVLGRGP